jgi:L-ascorbate metabolism protein UlaG (beta-lactamase superfamily)
MNKTMLTVLGATVLVIIGFYAFNNYIYNEKQGDNNTMQDSQTQPTPPPAAQVSGVKVTPITHATAVLSWNGKVIYTDPTGGAEAFAGQPQPNLILITDIHGDHLSADTLKAVSQDKTTVIVPQAVAELLPKDIPGMVVVMKNGETATHEGFSVQAIPMYNLPEAADSRHVKGRGNGYVLEAAGERVYVAGDTDDTPEMRALTGIDVAFVPMNPPFTMTVEEAASGVLAFKPKQVYPYHYRGQDGLSDVNKFKSLVDAGNQDIEVVLLDWYKE